jgi:hypothetical protein
MIGRGTFILIGVILGLDIIARRVGLWGGIVTGVLAIMGILTWTPAVVLGLAFIASCIARPHLRKLHRLGSAAAPFM